MNPVGLGCVKREFWQKTMTLWRKCLIFAVDRKNQAKMKRAAEAARRCSLALANYLVRLLYSSVRVSISILSPMLTKAGTGSSKPVEILAGFMTLPEVSPLTAGSV